MTELFDQKQVAFAEREHEATRGVKIKNKRSSIAEKAKQKSDMEQMFTSAADSYVKTKTERSAVGFELAKKFLLSLGDKTLVQNKGVISEDEEKMVRAKLLELAISLNNDEYEREGEGAIALISILMKSVIKLRDRINELEYAVYVLNKNASSTGSESR